jgi:hypothetical protein
VSPSSLTAAAIPWLAVAWIVTVVIVAALIYAIIHMVLSKADPQKLPDVLCALTPLLAGITRSLVRSPADASVDQEPALDSMVGQAGAESDTTGDTT